MILILFPRHFFGEAKGGRQEIKNCCPRRGITTQMTGDFFQKKVGKKFRQDAIKFRKRTPTSAIGHKKVAEAFAPATDVIS
ncbi:MAG: hypothetical protein MJZ96_02800 [Paludibacteraceae bacterium]|nr:hypothetical protein [Paludibacteraceae bacterium]